MRLGFSTNSIGDTDPLEAVAILADLGYMSLAITPDRQLLDPFSSGLPAELDAGGPPSTATGSPA